MATVQNRARVAERKAATADRGGWTDVTWAGNLPRGTLGAGDVPYRGLLGAEGTTVLATLVCMNLASHDKNTVRTG